MTGAAPGDLLRRVARRGRIVVPSLVAGVGLALSLPPWGLWVVAFPAAALLWWRIGGLRWRGRLLAGFCAGLGWFGTGLWWTLTFSGYGGAVLILVESLAPALACMLTPSRRGRAFALTGAMVLAEALRDRWPFGGLPIGGVVLGQAAGPLAGTARVGGPLLVLGLVWLGGSGLGLLATAVADAVAARRTAGPTAERASSTGRRIPGNVTTPAVVGLVCVAAVVALCGWGDAAPDGGRVVSTERVAAVQGGGVRGLRKDQVNPSVVYNAQRAATATIPAHDGGRPPVLVVWPEDVAALNQLLTASPVNGQLGAVAKSMHATLLVGVTESVSTTQFRNEEVAYSPAGRLVDRYEKVHRVPFGEYVPWRGFFSHIANLSAVPQDAIPGHSNGVLHTPAGALGTMVSYEVFFAERGWVPTRAGARLLIVPTNTASYSTSQVPTQEVAADRLQAIAEGRDLVQAATTGFSTFVDNRGRLVAHTTLGQRQVLVVDAGLRTGHTIYERVGDLGALVAAVALMVLGWLSELTGPEQSPVARAERRATAARRAKRATSSV